MMGKVEKVLEYYNNKKSFEFQYKISHYTKGDLLVYFKIIDKNIKIIRNDFSSDKFSNEYEKISELKLRKIISNIYNFNNSLKIIDNKYKKIIKEKHGKGSY